MQSSSFATTSQETLKIDDFRPLEKPLEFFNMEKLPNATIALITGFDYIKQHNENLLNELQTPKYFDEHKYMVLANNAQYQLNIVDYFNYDSINIKFQSLNDVINNCLTPMGKRYLRQRLCSPFTDAKVINDYYEMTDKLIKSKKIDETRSYLKCICDLDKLFRKISIKFIQPYELFNIYSSFDSLVHLVQLLLSTKLKSDLLNLFPKNVIDEFNTSNKYISDTFDIDKLKINNLVEVKESFYNQGIHPDIDEVQESILKGDNFLNKLTKSLESYDPDCTLHIKYNERDGYYLQTTLKRGKKLKSVIEKVDSIKIDKNKFIVNNVKSKLMNSGIYLFKKNILNHIKNKRQSLEEEILPKLIEQKKIKGMLSFNYFIVLSLFFPFPYFSDMHLDFLTFL
jgi:DNA mismatch repair ATPase MutS